MEPPAKRLRILQSVDVDETNPDYIAAKQKQQLKFKGRLESLFAKYEGLHESMSDEIDFRTGKLVVDRGHLRRLHRQIERKEPTLLDSLLEPGLDKEDASEKEEEQAESDDELAPTQAPKRKNDTARDQSSVAQPARQLGAEPVTSPSHTVPTEAVQANALQLPNTPNPAASLLQHVHFPQTPLGQQAQAAFYANLNQTIAQAVQHAVAPLLSSLFQITPNVPLAQAPVFPVPSPYISGTDNVRPATDPKWYFPPMSVAKEAQQTIEQRSSPPVMDKPLPEITNRVEASSPLVHRRRSPKVHVHIQRNLTPKKRLNPTTSPQLNLNSAREDSLPVLDSNNDSNPGVESPIILPSKVRFSKYQFSEEDDVYISRKRALHNLSFPEIKAGREKWSSWPASALYNRWINHIKDRQLHLQETLKTGRSLHSSSTPPEHEEQFFSSKEIPETSSASHHLPTPSSLGQNDSHVEGAVIPPSSHFDDDELELLSLAGADVGQEVPSVGDYEDDDVYPTLDEILPSIEGADFRNEDELQLEMLKTEESETEERVPQKALPSTIPETQDSIVIASSPSYKRQTTHKQKPKPKPLRTYRAMSDSESDLDLIGASDGPTPTTPRITIKRESLTPQASKFLCSSPAFKTPHAIPQSSRLVSSGAKSTGKLDRRAYLKEVKQSWTKKTPGAKGLQNKRRSLNLQPPAHRRRWAEVEDSDDELAA
ncbi:uncharacterized protein EKO05_0002164 [Ascochyta rabiei]|uniref:Nucleus n=1 Tax=Didymella rabiei TaxID=5454 RepID=A0A163JFB1_DIDRA|nr:uncharacterized protein EKO05_0002164 [Ascochyta rabiei]KZM26321.1 nucleus [Ascochyta rabiei]UPX11565.1 hypothetical protein EKO05_0002164 [Ascochyta rabiei]